MEIKAIVYTSKAGHTKQYAEYISKLTNIPCIPYKKALKELAAADRVYYLGWIMGGMIMNYQKAVERFTVAGVCGVGMKEASEEWLARVREVNKTAPETELSLLQGGFEMNRLHGMYKLMMKMLSGGLKNKKEPLTEDEQGMLNMVSTGTDLFSEEAAKEIADKIMAL